MSTAAAMSRRTFDLRSEPYRIFGVDLTNVPGINAITAQTILCEIGCGGSLERRRVNSPAKTKIEEALPGRAS